MQRYKCGNCNRVFKGGVRIEPIQIWNEYVKGKQTYQQLAEKHGCCIKTIQRKIDAVKVEKNTSFPGVVNLLMDTTYFGL